MSKFMIKIESPQHLDSVWVALLKQDMISSIHPSVDKFIRCGDSDTMVIRDSIPYFSVTGVNMKFHQELVLKNGELIPKEKPVYEGAKLGDCFRIVEGGFGFDGKVYMLFYVSEKVCLMNIESGMSWDSTYLCNLDTKFEYRVGDAAKRLLTGQIDVFWEKVNVDFTVSPVN